LGLLEFGAEDRLVVLRDRGERRKEKGRVAFGIEDTKGIQDTS
jgi:hypothetical protein